ncbi:MAG: hypothetical protein QXD04_06625 [Candidatus Bathyarchaeia archaeon]
MAREVRLIAYSNDAFALAISGFPLPLGRCKLATTRTKSLISIGETEYFGLKSRSREEVYSRIPPGSRYFTLEELLKGFPRGFSPKIERMTTLYTEGNEVYILEWVRNTIHQTTLEKDYQRWILNQISETWRTLLAKDMDGHGPLEVLRPSILIVESLRSYTNPSLELIKREGEEGYEEYFNLSARILSYLWRCGGRGMYTLTYLVEAKRGVVEFLPIDLEELERKVEALV